MPRTRKSTSRRRTSRSTSRKTYSRARRSPYSRSRSPRRASPRVSARRRSASGGNRTIKLVIQQAPAPATGENLLSAPLMAATKPPKKAKF